MQNVIYLWKQSLCSRQWWAMYFRLTATNFGNERLWVLKRFNLPPNFPEIEDYQRQNSPNKGLARKRERCVAFANHMCTHKCMILHTYLEQSLEVLTAMKWCAFGEYRWGHSRWKFITHTHIFIHRKGWNNYWTRKNIPINRLIYG